MRKIFLIVFTFVFSTQINAQEIDPPLELNTITTSVPFLIIGPDSKSGGMGDVGVASTPDANSMHWNPAKYAFVEDDMGFAINYVGIVTVTAPQFVVACSTRQGIVPGRTVKFVVS